MLVVEVLLKAGAVGIEGIKNPIKPIILKYIMGCQYVPVRQAHGHHNPLLYHYMSDTSSCDALDIFSSLNE